MGKKQTTTAQASPWSGAVPTLNNAMSQTNALYNDGGFRVDPYQGARVAEMSAPTIAGIGALSGGGPVAADAEAALISNLNMDDAYRDFDLIRDSAADSVKANLASTFAGGGINSGLAGDTYTRAMTETLAGLEYDAYNQAKARQMSAIGMAPTINTMGSGAQLMAGGIMDDYAQRQINADMGAYYEEENADLNALKEYANLGMGFGGMGGTSSESRGVPLTEQLYGAGIGLTGIGTALSFFSDERLKDDIWADGDKHVYSYKWSPVKFRGDLSKNVPHRVVGQVNGFDVVELS